MLIPQPTSILFFTGKGGVGKTSCACATAIDLAGAGKRVLLVSTDPASNLDEVLGVALTGEPLPVPGAPGLFALNIDPEAAAAAYRKRMVDPVRGLLPDAVVASMEEQLSGACTTEIAAFDEFSKLLGDPARTAGYDHILFDTAPTGHTLRLLELPSAWSSFIDSNAAGNSCLGPTLAARLAIHLAEQGFRVTLTTTDPAAHVERAAFDRPPSLRVTRIDPEQAVRSYRAEVMASAGQGLDADGRAMLEEDLRSPCTEEIAIFRAFADTVAQGQDQFVVIDTAPTGHTLLLLDAAEAYHREVLRTASGLPEAVRQLLPRLRDPAFTRILLVTLAEATPIHEAMQLEWDLARAGIRPYAWVANQSLTPLGITDPVLRARQAHEAVYLKELLKHAERLVLEPLLF